MSFWLCSLLAVVSMSVTIGCLWFCICVVAWIADCESVNMMMFFNIQTQRIAVVTVIGNGL